jgi:hypothetical protein
VALKWLGGGKPDHPLADEKGAKEVLSTLPPNDPAKAIQDIRDWIESVLGTVGFKGERRGEVVMLLDEAAQVHQRKLARDYLANPSLPKFQETRLWGAQFGLWKDLASAYAACLAQFALDPGSVGKLKAQLPLFCVRAVRAVAAQLKWHYMHYEQGDAAVWEMLGKVYRFAEEKKVHRESVPVYPGVPVSSSAEREFMKALMLAASSPDCLMPLDIELAERIVAHFSGSFLISDVHRPQATYNWIDLARGVPPKRLTQTPPPSPGLRFFAAGAALGQLDGMIRVVEGGAVPADLNLGGTYEPEKVLGVLRHLKLYWAATPPVRKNDRYAVKHRLTVVNGFEGILARLKGAAGAAGAAGGTGDAGAESWVTENISSGGIGATLGKGQSDWLRIGKLVGLSVEGGSGACSVGVVRRCSRLAQQQTSVGVRTFAKESFAVTLGGREQQDALLLNDGRTLKEEALICQREGAFNKRNSPSLEFDGHRYLLIPIEVSETGDDFELARYKVMQQS